MNTDKMLPIVAVILPLTIFCFTVAVSYCCGRSAARQEQTNEAITVSIDYWRLKNAMRNVGIEDIVVTHKDISEIIWACPLEKIEQLNRGNR